MRLNSKEIRKLIKSHDLIEDVDPEQMEYMEGGGYDVRLGEVSRLVMGSQISPAIGTKVRIPPRYENVSLAWDEELEEEAWSLGPGIYRLVTLEQVNAPDWIRVVINPRVSIGEFAMILQVSSGAPGFRGKYVFTIFNFTPLVIRLAHKCRIATFTFTGVMPERDTYKGPRREENNIVGFKKLGAF